MTSLNNVEERIHSEKRCVRVLCRRDEKGEGTGKDAQRRMSDNANLKGFLSCMNL